MGLESYEGKRVLITGGLGFIGSNLAHKLVEFGSKVTILNRGCVKPYGANLHNIKDIEDELRLEIGDIRGDEIRRFVDGQDIIFHLAGQVGNYSRTDPFFQTYQRDARSINVDGTRNILSSCLEVNPNVRVIHAGSSFQYGPPQYTPVDEMHPSEPDKDNLYAVSKNEADILLMIFHDEFDLDTVRFRIANPYGPRAQMRHHNYGFLNWFIRRAMDGQLIEIYGTGDQKKDMIYIDDLVRAFLIAGLDKRTKGEAFNVGSGKGYTIRELAEEVVKVVGDGSVRLTGAEIPERYKKQGMPSYISDIRKIQSIMGWSPSIHILEGIKRTFEFYEKNRHHYW